MKKFYRLFPCLLPLLLLSPATRAEAVEFQTIRDFVVVPGSCIIKADDDCKVQFKFYWELQQEEQVCIFQQPNRRAIYCAPSVRAGETTLELAVPSDTDFTLQPQINSHLSATRRVEVLTVGKDVRLLRRHVWSIL